MKAEADSADPDAWVTTTSQTSVAPVASFSGVRHSIWEVVTDTVSQTLSQTVTATPSSESKPVPVMVRREPPPKLPLAGVTDKMSSVEVKVSSLDRPRSALSIVTVYSPPGRPTRSQDTVDSEEAVTVHSVAPTITEGDAPKLEPVKDREVGPDEEAGEKEVISGEDAVA